MSAPASLETRASQRIYDEAVAHLKACHLNKAYLSDTWAHTLEHNSRFWTRETMLGMLSLGNPINRPFDDGSYLIDSSVLDLKDPVVKSLLRSGENDFGRPRRDLRLAGRNYSSNFIHHVVYAAKIIAAIEERGLKRPRVLEIGGGLAGVAYLLRRRFGDAMTYYSVDLPETLLLQEWYLRHCFPEAPTSFKATAERRAFADGGFNFVNAYALASQDIAIDVAINIDSMQEMNREAITAYIRYIEKNIAPNGLFYFQNHFGQSSDPITEPSEYPFDELWTLRKAEFAPQAECCTGAEQARWILYRQEKRENAATRRHILRLLWNGFVSGRIANDAALVAELARLPSKPAAVLRRRGVRLPAGALEHLKTSKYLPYESTFAEALNGNAPLAAKGFQEKHAQVMWSAQSRVLQLMESARVGASVGKLSAGLSTVEDRLASPKDTARSEYWSGYFGSFLSALGRKEAARSLLLKASRNSDNPFWLVRFAHLLDRCDLADDARSVLARMPAGKLDFYVAAKKAELEGSRRELQALGAEAGEDPTRLACVAKTASRIGHAALAEDCALRLAGIDLTLALGALRAMPEAAARLARGLRPANLDSNLDQLIAYAAVLIKLGDPVGASLVEPLPKRLARDKDYYRLGQLGKIHQDAGNDALADECFGASISLRPKNFMHLEFVGRAYIEAGRWSKARSIYARALALKPYPRYVIARHLYAGLPAAVRDSGIFGSAADLGKIFQREQYFYHDLGPRSK